MLSFFTSFRGADDDNVAFASATACSQVRTKSGRWFSVAPEALQEKSSEPALQERKVVIFGHWTSKVVPPPPSPRSEASTACSEASTACSEALLEESSEPALQESKVLHPVPPPSSPSGSQGGELPPPSPSGTPSSSPKPTNVIKGLMSIDEESPAPVPPPSETATEPRNNNTEAEGDSTEEDKPATPISSEPRAAASPRVGVEFSDADAQGSTPFEHAMLREAFAVFEHSMTKTIDWQDVEAAFTYGHLKKHMQESQLTQCLINGYGHLEDDMDRAVFIQCRAQGNPEDWWCLLVEDDAKRDTFVKSLNAHAESAQKRKAEQAELEKN